MLDQHDRDVSRQAADHICNNDTLGWRQARRRFVEQQKPRVGRERHGHFELALLAIGQLADQLPVTRSAVSQHLKILKNAGLVSEEAVGTRRIYRLNPTAVAALRDQLDTFWQRALGGYADIAGQPTEESE